MKGYEKAVTASPRRPYSRFRPPLPRVRSGKVSITDGPFAETKEQLAGFYMIEARDLNEAIQIAAKIPPARVGSIEVRPIRPIRDTVAQTRSQKNTV